MPRILANDGLHPEGIKMLESAGFEVITEKIEQEDLMTKLNDFDGIIVRSATKVRKDLIDACPNLSFIGRGGVGMDNIDVEYARSIGRTVANTPGASSQSVAELVFAHLFSISRNLYKSNREMPVKGASDFKSLKKSFSKGQELRGKVLGIIGFGRIGQLVAKMALGMGMRVMPCEIHRETVNINIDFFKIKDASFNIKVTTDQYEDLLKHSDYITIHIPFSAGSEPVISKKEFDQMKDGVMIVNSSRGGVIKEDDLLDALKSGKVAAAGLDVFEGEPKPRKEILEHPQISLTPHIGASTLEAQTRIGTEMAEMIIAHFKQA